jgi:hypothetical protein
LNIFLDLDLDLNIRISDFWSGISSEEPPISSLSNLGISKRSPSVGCDYLTAGCCDQIAISATPVFSFGLILYELIVDQGTFLQHECPKRVLHKVIVEK